METKHTKGEWNYRLNSANQYGIFSNDYWIGDINNLNHDGTLNSYTVVQPEESEANAKLIAAAPENLIDNIEWLEIHKELLKQNINIPKQLSDRIFYQTLKSQRTITKATK